MASLAPSGAHEFGNPVGSGTAAARSRRCSRARLRRLVPIARLKVLSQPRWLAHVATVLLHTQVGIMSIIKAASSGLFESRAHGESFVVLVGYVPGVLVLGGRNPCNASVSLTSPMLLGKACSPRPSLLCSIELAVLVLNPRDGEVCGRERFLSESL